MRNEALPEGWSVSRAVLPSLRGKEGGSAPHLNATAGKSSSRILTSLPTRSVAPCGSCDFLGKPGSRPFCAYSPVISWHCARLDALPWNRLPQRGHQGASLGGCPARSQQPGSRDRQGRVAGPVPGQRKEASCWNYKMSHSSPKVSPPLCFGNPFHTS